MKFVNDTNKTDMRGIKAMLGNLINRLTGSSVLIDEEWNKAQLKKPDKKSWIYLLIFALILVLLMVILPLIFK